MNEERDYNYSSIYSGTLSTATNGTVLLPQSPPQSKVQLHVPAVLAQPALDAIRQIVREEVRLTTRLDNLEDRILSLIIKSFEEIESTIAFKAINVLQDAVEAGKEMRGQRAQEEVEEETQSL